MHNKQAALEEAVASAPILEAHQLRRLTMTGAWLTILPSKLNGTEMGDQEWRNSLFLHYVIETPDLPHHFDGCNYAFSICHTLDCKKGGLIINLHDELHDGFADLTGKEFTPSHVRDDPLIHPCRAVREGKGPSYWI